MFCDRLKEIRIMKDITQEELALALRMSRQAVTKYESGERFPDEVTLVNIANYLETSLDYLLGRKASNIELLANAIAIELSKIESITEVSEEKIGSIINVLEALIIEFEKYDPKLR